MTGVVASDGGTVKKRSEGRRGCRERDRWRGGAWWGGRQYGDVELVAPHMRQGRRSSGFSWGRGQRERKFAGGRRRWIGFFGCEEEIEEKN